MLPFPSKSASVTRKERGCDQISFSGSDFSQFSAFDSNCVAPTSNDHDDSHVISRFLPCRTSFSPPRSPSSPLILAGRPRSNLGSTSPPYRPYPGHRNPSSPDSYPRPNPPSFVDLKIDGLIPLENPRPAPSPPSSLLPQSLGGVTPAPPSPLSTSPSSSHSHRTPSFSSYEQPYNLCSVFSPYTTPKGSISSIRSGSSGAVSQYRIPRGSYVSHYALEDTEGFAEMRSRYWTPPRTSFESDNSLRRRRDSRETESIAEVDEGVALGPEDETLVKGVGSGMEAELADDTLTKPRLVGLKKSLSMLWPRKSSRGSSI